MITLPRAGTLSRGPLRAFWLTVWTLAAVGAAAATRGGAARRGAVGAAVLTVGGAPGLVRPSVARRPYLAWSALSERFARQATAYTAWVTYTTALDGRTAGDDDRRPVAHVPRSAWIERGTQPAGAYRSPSLDPAHGRDRPLAAVAGWLGDQPGRRRWLLTCLAALRWLQATDGPIDPPARRADSYTLY